jgi:hypothetical protein
MTHAVSCVVYAKAVRRVSVVMLDRKRGYLDAAFVENPGHHSMDAS